jgi:chemotaxis protein histidine kinase CheA
MAKERRQIRVLKHHPFRGSYERLLDISDSVLHTVNPQTPCVTNTYSLHDVQLLETPNDGRRVRLRVPSRNFCGQLEELALSPINPSDYEQLLKFMRDAVNTTATAEVIVASPGELAVNHGRAVNKGAWTTPSTEERTAPSTVQRDRVAAEDAHAAELERAVAAVAEAAEAAHAAELEREAAAAEAAAAEAAQAKADAEQLTEEGARQAAALRAAEAHATELQAALDGATRREAAAAAREVAAVARHMAASQAASAETNEMREEAERAYETELSRLELQAERAHAAEVQVAPTPALASPSRLTFAPRPLNPHPLAPPPLRPPLLPSPLPHLPPPTSAPHPGAGAGGDRARSGGDRSAASEARGRQGRARRDAAQAVEGGGSGAEQHLAPQHLARLRLGLRRAGRLLLAARGARGHSGAQQGLSRAP